MPGMRSATIHKAAAEAGVCLSLFFWGKGRKYSIDWIIHGIAYRRTAMAEAACKAMKNCGVKAMMYYQMD